MRVALIKPPHLGSHVRGVGFYAERLFSSLEMGADLQIQWENFSLSPLKYTNLDLVHFTYFDLFYLTFPPVRLSKTVVTLHDVIPLKFPEHFPLGKRGKIIWPIQKKLLNTANAVVTDSETSKKDIVDLTNYPDEKIFVTYLAADPEFKPLKATSVLEKIKAKYKLPERFVLYVGGVNWNKNLPTLVKACHKISVNLIIVGQEALGDQLNLNHIESQSFKEVLSLIKNDSHIKRLGFVPTSELSVIYNLATVYVQPSFYEGFGLPVLEALSCGTPVICGHNSSLSEIGSNVALFTDITSVDNLASKISEVMDWSKVERDRQSQSGVAQARKFSWEKTAKETIEVYKKVLAKN